MSNFRTREGDLLSPSRTFSRGHSPTEDFPSLPQRKLTDLTFSPQSTLSTTDSVQLKDTVVTSDNIDPHTRIQPHIQETHNITEKMMHKIRNAQIYNKLSKTIKESLLNDLAEIEEKYQHEIRRNFESHTNIQSIDLLSEQVNSLATTMQQKLTSLTEEINTMKVNIQTSNKTSTSSTPSYAEAARRKAVLFGTDKTPPKKLLQKLQTAPALASVSVTNIKSRQNHLELTATNTQEKENLKSTIKEAFPELRIEDKRIPSIRLILHNATQYSNEKIIQALQNYNFETEEINFVRTLRSKQEGIDHAIIELPKQKTQNTLLRNYSPTRPSFIYIGLQRLYFKIFVRLNRCRNCQSLEHSTFQCKSEPFCAHCGEGHYESDCKNDKPYCINCADYNNSLPPNNSSSTFNPLHAASSNACPSYKAKLRELIYDQTTYLPQPDQQEPDLRPRRN